MMAASSVLSVIYKIHNVIGLPCSNLYNWIRCVGVLAVSANHAFCTSWRQRSWLSATPQRRPLQQSSRLPAPKAKLRYGPHNASGRTRMDVGWHRPSQTASIIVTPSSRTTDNNGNQLSSDHLCGFIIVQTTWPHPAADIGNTLGELLHWCSWYPQLQCWFAKCMTSNLVQFYVSQLGLWVRKFPPENFRKFIPIFPEISGNLYFRKISANFY